VAPFSILYVFTTPSTPAALLPIAISVSPKNIHIFPYISAVLRSGICKSISACSNSIESADLLTGEPQPSASSSIWVYVASLT
jgi:hypothetical protein